MATTLRAYYTATPTTKFVTVRSLDGCLITTRVVQGLRDARRLCKAYGWTLWNA